MSTLDLALRHSFELNPVIEAKLDVDVNFDLASPSPISASFDVRSPGIFLRSTTRLGVVACLLLATNARAEPGCEALRSIFDTAESGSSPGFAVAVVAEGVLRCTAGFGTANLEFAQPVTAQTRFNIASLSKQFTAYALVREASARRLELDHTVAPPIAGGAAAAANVTIRQLLAHTSGLRDIETLFPMSGARPGDVITQGDAVAMIHRQQALNFTPGSRFLYSNSGYALAAEIAQATSGIPFDTLLSRQAFQPAGMRHTTVLTEPDAVIEQMASSYALDRTTGRWRHQPYNSTILGSTNVVSTAADLGAWAQYLLRLESEGDATVRAMTKAVQTSDGNTNEYGLGLEIGVHRGLEVWSHTGAQAGYRSALMMFPDIDAAVVVLGNGSRRTLPLAEKTADVFFGNRFPVPPSHAQEAQQATRSPSMDGRIAGIYEVEPGLVLEVAVAGERITVSMDPLGTVLLTSLSDGHLIHASSGIEFHFDEIATGQFTRVRVTGVRPPLIGRRQTSVRIPVERLPALTGLYYSPELQTHYELGAIDDRLSVRIPHLPPLPLTALDGGRFVAPEVGLTLQFPDLEARQSTSFLAHTWRVKGIEFSRTPKIESQ